MKQTAEMVNRLVMSNEAEHQRLATSVQFEASGKHYALAISSAFQGEGKTTLSLNLAKTLAWNLEGEILLVDADFYNPKVHERCHVEPEPGLSEILLRNDSIELGLKKTDLPNLFILPSGHISSNPSRLIRSNRMQLLITELKKRFQYTVFDSPSVFPDSDCSILASLVDGLMLVVLAGITPADAVRKALSRLEKADANIFGIVLNAVDQQIPNWLDRLL